MFCGIIIKRAIILKNRDIGTGICIFPFARFRQRLGHGDYGYLRSRQRAVTKYSNVHLNLKTAAWPEEGMVRKRHPIFCSQTVFIITGAEELFSEPVEPRGRNPEKGRMWAGAEYAPGRRLFLYRPKSPQRNSIFWSSRNITLNRKHHL
jgi:hypothetical protein